MTQSSPIFSLPGHVLARVFTLATPLTIDKRGPLLFDPPSYPRVNHTFTPFVLSRVCRAWEGLASSIPSLWTTFACSVEGWDDEKRAILELCLKHSAGAPLHVAVYVQTGRPDALARLVAEAHRWRSLQLHANVDPSFAELAPLVQLPAGSLQSLEDLALCLHPRRTGPVSRERLDAWCAVFSSAPRLSRLYIGLGSLDDLLPWSAFPLPWDHLRDLTAHCHLRGVRSPPAILRLCPGLVSCRLNAAMPDWIFEHREPILMPNLGYLMLAGEGPTETLLCRLRTPSLRTVISYDRSWEVKALDGRASIGDFLKSAHNLEEIELHTRMIAPRALVDGLRLTPSITRLTLLADLDESVLPILELCRALVREDDGAPILSNLRYLALRISRKYMNGDLLDIVEQRWRAPPSSQGARLEHFQFEYLSGPAMMPEVIARIKALREEGMTIVVKYTKPGWKMGLPAGAYRLWEG